MACFSVAAHAWQAALHVDTGMNRLGISVEEAATPRPKIRISLLLSHLACADNPMTVKQDIQSFGRAAYALSRRSRLARQLLRHFPRAIGRISIRTAGSRALWRQSGASQSDYSVDGDLSCGASRLNRRSAMRHMDGKARLADRRRRARLRLLRAGSGADDRPAARRSSPGTLSEGRIRMDSVCVDVTDRRAARLAWRKRIGADITVDHVAAAAGTIGYGSSSSPVSARAAISFISVHK